MNNKLLSKQLSTAAFAASLFFSLSSTAFASSKCENFKGCEKKFCEIEKQLAIAIENGNKRKENGLTESLANAKAHCTDKGLEKDLREEIKSVQEEIIEYESDLAEAKRDKDADKVRKYQKKIDKEKNKLKRLESELSDLVSN